VRREKAKQNNGPKQNDRKFDTTAAGEAGGQKEEYAKDTKAN
jgi:hypothetical protein